MYFSGTRTNFIYKLNLLFRWLCPVTVSYSHVQNVELIIGSKTKLHFLSNNFETCTLDSIDNSLDAIQGLFMLDSNENTRHYQFYIDVFASNIYAVQIIAINY